MTEMSMVETLQIWSDGVSSMEKGDFDDALMRFMALEGRTDSTQTLITSARNLFNIGQTYLAIGRVQMATQVSHLDRSSCVWCDFSGNLSTRTLYLRKKAFLREKRGLFPLAFNFPQSLIRPLGLKHKKCFQTFWLWPFYRTIFYITNLNRSLFF